MTSLHAAPDDVRRREARATFAADAAASRGADRRDRLSLAEAIAAAPTLAALETLGRAHWTRWATGALDDEEAQSLAAVASARRLTLKGQGRGASARATGGPGHHRPPLPRGRFPARRSPPCVDRDASRARRRLLAASGVMPPALAQRFTTGELATLKIVADEIAARGDCRLPIGAVAARAGVSETTARNALRAADYASLRGAYKFDVNGYPIQDFHVFQVAKDSAGRVSLKTIATPLKAHRDAYVSECKY